MGLIQLDAVQAGMVLGNDVRDQAGQVLLRQGVQINEKHLRVLRTWGVTHVEVAGLSQSSSEEQFLAKSSPEILRQADDEAGLLFQRSNLDNPVIRELLKIATTRIVERLITESCV